MNIYVKPSSLNSGLKVVRTILKTSSDDVDGMVLLDGFENKLVLAAHAGVLSIIHVINDIKVESAGKICLLFRDLFQFTNSFNDRKDDKGVEFINIKANKDYINVFVKNYINDVNFVKSNVKLGTYPTHRIYVPGKFDKPDFAINSQLLREAINKVIYSINPVFQKSFLTNMRVEFDSENITFVGTDALKLSSYVLPNTGSVTGAYNFPYKFVTALNRILKEDEQVLFDLSKHDIKALVGDTVLVSSKAKDDDYPDYKSLFLNYSKYIIVNKKLLLDSFSPFLGLLNDDDDKRITLELKNGILSFYNSQVYSECIIDKNNKDKFIIDINASFLFKIVESINDDNVLIYYIDDKHPLVFDNTKGTQKSLIAMLKR